MIVLLKMKDGETKKAFIRNGIFHEVDAINKKVGAITSNQIKSVLWTKEKKMQEVQVKEWIEMAEAASYWNLD